MISELIELIRNAEKPETMQPEDHRNGNNGFSCYDIWDMDDPSLELTGEEKTLARFAYSITHRTQSQVDKHHRMNPTRLFKKQGLLYVSGGILVGSEGLSKIMGDFFDIMPGEEIRCGVTNHGGMGYLLGLKQTDQAVQFVSQGVEWESRPGYAHMCMGHVPR